ncbi:synaptobrevin-domain-containing protein [Chytridium lagenaria]|nr:synaptobrevin-domain-containing protein [Chytridium lagenaria]
MPSKSRSASVGPAASSPSASSPSISRPSSAKTVQTQATAGKAGTAKTAQVQAQVDEVINIMHTNVEKVIMRGEKLEDLQSKTADLKQGAIQFRKGGGKG